MRSSCIHTFVRSSSRLDLTSDLLDAASLAFATQQNPSSFSLPSFQFTIYVRLIARHTSTHSRLSPLQFSQSMALPKYVTSIDGIPVRSIDSIGSHRPVLLSQGEPL